jgi:hypothetical protein
MVLRPIEDAGLALLNLTKSALTKSANQPVSAARWLPYRDFCFADFQTRTQKTPLASLESPVPVV